jgi:hypothetical protein
MFSDLSSDIRNMEVPTRYMEIKDAMEISVNYAVEACSACMDRDEDAFEEYFGFGFLAFLAVSDEINKLQDN